jgi:hypothetical protein
MVTMKEFTGSKLTHGAFVQMNQEVRKLIIQTTSRALKLEDEMPAYSAAIDKMDKLVKCISGYEEITKRTGFINEQKKGNVLTFRTSSSTIAATCHTQTTSADDVRKQVTVAYRTIVARVNVARQLFASDVITKFINDANTVAAHYQIVSVNQVKKSKEETNL